MAPKKAQQAKSQQAGKPQQQAKMRPPAPGKRKPTLEPPQGTGPQDWKNIPGNQS